MSPAPLHLSRSIGTIDHVYPVAGRGSLDHLYRCASDFDILPIGSFASNAPIGGAKTDVPIFVDMAHSQLDGNFSAGSP